MAQQINDNFQILAGLPIDDRIQKATIADRDAIASTRRFQGLKCFVVQTQTEYQLQGGISNENWVGVIGADVSNDIETIIEGFYVLSAGKETILDWEVNDKFRGWIGNRYVVGTILTLPVSLPSDIDNILKVELAINSDSFTSPLQKISYPRLLVAQQDFDIDIGRVASFAVINGAMWHLEDSNLLSEPNTFTQSGSTVTFKTIRPIGNLIIIYYQ